MVSSWLNRVFIFIASSGGLPNNETTFAKALLNQGYKTALIGKWHLGNFCSSKTDACHNPLEHGFQYFYGLPLTNLKDFGKDGSSVILSFFPSFNKVIIISILCVLVATYIAIRCDFCVTNVKRIKTKNAIIITIVFILLFNILFIFGFQRNLTRLNSILMRNKQIIEQPIQMETITERLTNESIRFIEKQHSKNEKFLLMLAFTKVHSAHFPSKKFKGKSIHGKYGDSVMEMDWAIGQIIKTLQNLGIGDDTFIYFSSDNGGHLEEYSADGEYEGGYNGVFPGGKGQGAMEGGIRVPTIISWPNYNPNSQNKTCKVPTSQMDLFPTLLDLSGISNYELSTLDGESLLDLLNDEEDSNYDIHKNRFFIHYCGTYIHGARYYLEKDKVYKIYYYKPKFISDTEFKCNFMCRCYGDNVIKLDPAEVYNVAIDLSESNQLNTKKNTKEMKKILKLFDQAIKKHQASLKPVDLQLSFWKTIWKPHLQPCCNFPYCTCRESD